MNKWEKESSSEDLSKMAVGVALAVLGVMFFLILLGVLLKAVLQLWGSIL